jgi:glucose-6-phosphate-specific signal transduction histidine kinase
VTEDEPAVLAGAADATDPTRAEEIRLRYAVSVESSDDAIIAKTLDGVISAWNAAAERMFGYTEKEAIGQPITTIITPELHDQEQNILRRLRAGERLEHYCPPNRIRPINQQIADLAFDIQALSHRLHPSKVELLGLEAGAAGLCDELSHRHDVQIDVHFENVPTALPSGISLCLYRVLQEALQNAVKHSGSPRAHVSITGGVNNINLTVEDSGVGFDPRGTMIQALVPL